MLSNASSARDSNALQVARLPAQSSRHTRLSCLAHTVHTEHGPCAAIHQLTLQQHACHRSPGGYVCVPLCLVHLAHGRPLRVPVHDVPPDFIPVTLEQHICLTQRLPHACHYHCGHSIL
jgi:hypothetical protein